MGSSYLHAFFFLINMADKRKLEKYIAVASFCAAVILAFLSVFITDEHDIPNGNLIMCAQFLTLTATIFGVDYKFNEPPKKPS